MNAYQTATEAELKRMLYDNQNLYAVIGDTELTNQAARKVLFDMPSCVLNYMMQKGCLYIWGVK
jgi:hypothetical protein